MQIAWSMGRYLSGKKPDQRDQRHLNRLSASEAGRRDGAIPTAGTSLLTVHHARLVPPAEAADYAGAGRRAGTEGRLRQQLSTSLLGWIV
jgi:hypothetical protein